MPKKEKLPKLKVEIDPNKILPDGPPAQNYPFHFHADITVTCQTQADKEKLETWWATSPPEDWQKTDEGTYEMRWEVDRQAVLDDIGLV